MFGSGPELHILFGPENDARHIDPTEPGGYEWWYFDAVSDDGNWALVAIFFLGTPMSPYYKAVVDGRRPIPSDWCGVFFSLHEKVSGKWCERSYAYNLYSAGDFSDLSPSAIVGGSVMRSELSAKSSMWELAIDERALWRGTRLARLQFMSPSAAPSSEATAVRDSVDSGSHTWVCVAPQCRVTGQVETADGRTIEFNGCGYHDHNFGTLPYKNVDIWYWGRAMIRGNDGATYLAIYYDTEYLRGPHDVVCLLFDSAGRLLTGDRANGLFASSIRNAYGLAYNPKLTLGVHGKADFEERFLQAKVRMRHEDGVFSEGPFYRRLPFTIEIADARSRADETAKWSAEGVGICEVFRPARLCGPIASRAMWSRMRRRRT